jgi:hypothetical protein
MITISIEAFGKSQLDDSALGKVQNSTEIETDSQY